MLKRLGQIELAICVVLLAVITGLWASTGGFSFAGVPGVVIGHNARIAWGVTNVGPDTQDYYIERPNPANPDEFEFKGAFEKAKIIDEVINVGGGQPVTIKVRITRHGPIMSDVVGDLKTVQREVESGISSKAPLGLRLQEQWRSLRDRTLGEWLLPGVVLLIALAVLISVFARPSAYGVIPGLILPGVAGQEIDHQDSRLRHNPAGRGRRHTEDGPG